MHNSCNQYRPADIVDSKSKTIVVLFIDSQDISIIQPLKILTHPSTMKKDHLYDQGHLTVARTLTTILAEKWKKMTATAVYGRAESQNL